MNKLSTAKRVAILKSLCEGASVSATSRITGASKVTILRLVEAAGDAALVTHSQLAKNLPCERVQADEQWAFIYSKDRNTSPEHRETGERGNSWTWVALDADSKFVITWRVGQRGQEDALYFMDDLASRLANRVQLTTDALSAYQHAISHAFGYDGVDYARLLKVFAPGERVDSVARRYSPPEVIGSTKQPIFGTPDPEHISTSYVERVNLTTRMQNRRFTRLTNAHSKKLANHEHALALHFFYYNWCRPNMTLTKANGGIKMTPAMAMGLTSRVWDLEELVRLL